MEKQKAHVSFILDQSASMSAVKQATISGFNEYINGLKGDKTVNYTFDLTFFNTSVTKRYVNAPLASLEPLTDSIYQPIGGTALYDAVCETILEKKPQSEYRKWIVVIMTDGEENSSQKHNKSELADYVKLLQNTGMVTFVFMGANQDAWATAQKFGMYQGNTMSYNATDEGTRAAFASMSAGTTFTAQSMQGSSQNFFQISGDSPKDSLDWQSQQQIKSSLSDQINQQGGIA